MSKTLAESAAEILKASMGAPKDPMPSMSAEVQDLGGSSTEKPEGDAIGDAAAAKVKVAPKPGQSGAPAEPMKKGAPDAEQVIDEKGLVKEEEDAFANMTEEEINAFLESLSEEELAALAEEFDEEEAAESSEEAPEQIDEMGTAPTAGKGKAPVPMPKKVDLKVAVSKNMGSMKEDVDALFNGESLSEEFRTKATTIFEAAVRSRVEAVLEEVVADNEKYLEESVEVIQENIASQIDEYLNYVVEQWMNDNQVAIDSGIRAELAEDFISGLKNLFTEHYIEIPEEKVDIAEELASKVLDLETELSNSAEALEKIASELNEAKKAQAITRVCEGLTKVQIEKMKSLAEGVEFTTEGEFDKKLALIRESYFPANKTVKIEEKNLTETSEDSEVEATGLMSHYVKAISKTVPKTGE